MYVCANARLLLLCRLSIPIVSDRLTSVDIRRYTRTKNYLDGLDGAKRIINSLNSLSKVLSTYVTKPPLVICGPTLLPRNERNKKTIGLSFIKAAGLSFNKALHLTLASLPGNRGKMRERDSSPWLATPDPRGVYTPLAKANLSFTLLLLSMDLKERRIQNAPLS